MAETFFVRLLDDDTAAWGAFDAAGRLVGSLGRGSLDAAHTALAGRRCTVLVRAVDVLFAAADLPAASQARLRQIVPFSLEESLADDVENIAFAIGARRGEGATTVAAVAKERLTATLERLRQAGIVPNVVCSEAEGVPDMPATLVLFIEGERLMGRLPDQPPFALDGLSLREALESVLGAPLAEADVRHLRVLMDQGGRARFGDELAALADAFAGVEGQVAGDGIFPHLAATLAQREGTNLLQGAYAPKSNWLALARPWRFAASLVAVSAALALVSQGARVWQLQRADVALAEVLADNCQRIVGESSVSACQREVRQRLGTGANGGGEDFLSTLAAVAAVRTDDTRIDALSYRNRIMDLQLIAPSVSALDEFSRALEQTRRFDVEIEAANQRDAGTEGRVKIVGANP